MQVQRAQLRQPKLRQTLYGFQVFFIVLSAIIGSGIFNNNGEALAMVGPGGLLLSVIIIGSTAICVSESVGEMTQQFPVYNAIVEYVRTFVDEDLGWIIGIAYWYSLASVFMGELLIAANLSSYWSLSRTWQNYGFYILSPVLMILLNLLGVFWFGVVETIGGALKVLLVFGTSVLLFAIAAKGGITEEAVILATITDGIQYNPQYSHNRNSALCHGIPLVAFSFIGVETIAVAAYEARSSKALRFSSQWTSYIVFILYLLCTIGETLNVKWTNPNLPGYINSTGVVIKPNSESTVVVALWTAGYHKLAGIINGCLIFSVLSTSNTSLYVASRTLYGMAREMTSQNRLIRAVRVLGFVIKYTRVPGMALLLSAVTFCWLPWIQGNSDTVKNLTDIITMSASVSTLIVWAALCLAFIRYHWWLKICETDLQENNTYYIRSHENYAPRTFLDWLQPGVAWGGLLGSMSVVIFITATFWGTPVTFTKIAVALGTEIILLPLWAFLKWYNGRFLQRWWVYLHDDATILLEALDRLHWKKVDGATNGGSGSVLEPPSNPGE